MRVEIDGSPLAIDEVTAVAHGRAQAVAAPDLDDRMAPALDLVRERAAQGVVTYGVTTVFGALASTRISPDEAEELQVDLVRSHAAGVGPYLDREMTRAMLLLRARTLAQGHSGVRPDVVRYLLRLLDEDLLPAVPMKGSVGASGDLAPFAHLALPVVGEGWVFIEGEARPAAEALAARGIEPLVLQAKEGLSLLNGTEGMLAMGCLAIEDSMRLIDAADAACALSVEALLASAKPFDPRIQALRPHPGQAESARVIRELLVDSEIVASHADDFMHAVQDAYSVRCAPQVHGAVRDTVRHAATVFERELGAVVDNPIVFPSDADIISGGNFHGQPLAFALDFLAIAISELGSISERRTDRILDPDRSSGLPPFLAPRPGVNSGYMVTQYTAAALVAENRVLAHPASVDSIPTSGLQEDHVSMGWGAGLKLRSVIENTRHILGVELVCAASGSEYRAPLAPATGTAAVLAAVRDVVPPLVDDRPVGVDIEAASDLIARGGITAAIRPFVG